MTSTTSDNIGRFFMGIMKAWIYTLMIQSLIMISQYFALLASYLHY